MGIGGEKSKKESGRKWRGQMGRVLLGEKKRKKKKLEKPWGRRPPCLGNEEEEINKKKEKAMMKSGNGRRMDREVGKKIKGKIMNENRECHVRGMGERERVDGGVGGEWKKREERENNKK